MDRPLRILLAPLDICGIFGCLRNGFAALGHEAHFVDLGRAAQGGLPPETAWPIRAFHRAHHRTQQTISMAKWMPQRILWSVLYCASRALLTIWAIFRVDVFVLKSGESLYSSLVDQKIFRALNKTIVHAFYGSDERPPYLNPGIGGVDDIDQLAERVRAKRELVDAVRAYADIAISNPLSAHFQTGRICVSQALGAPIDERKLAARHDAEHVEPAKPGHIRVLHAPSSTALKGTELIRREIDSLMRRGYRIQYIEVTGRPNAEVLKEIELCDFVVDELYSDDYGAVLATEAVVLGRPAIVAGYGRKELDRFVPKDAVLPALYCHPKDFGTLLEKMVADPAFRAEQRRKAEAFAPRRTAVSVAQRFVELIEGRAPDAWFFDAGDIRYVQGVGGPEARIAERIRKLVDALGPASLCLDDKPALRNRMIDFARAQSRDEAA